MIGIVSTIVGGSCSGAIEAIVSSTILDEIEKPRLVSKDSGCVEKVHKGDRLLEYIFDDCLSF